MTMDRFSEAFDAAKDAVTKEKFPADWGDVISKAKGLLAGTDGPDPAKEAALADLRSKLVDGAKPGNGKPGAKPGAQIVAASKDTSTISVQRAATLKMLKHLHLAGQSGSQTLWVYSPPKAYTRWVFDEIDGLAEQAMQGKLDDEGELYTLEHRKVMAEALVQATKVCGKVQAELGVKPGSSGVDAKTTALVQKWFFGDTAPSKEDMEAAVAKLRTGFRDIAAACGDGKVIFSDEPVYRAKPGKWANFAMIKSSEKMMVLYMMKGFLDEAGKPKAAERWLCVETIIHELSHKVVKTDDYTYDYQGLKPGGEKFAAGAGLDNADSWGYFACEVDGILPSANEAKVYKVPSKVIKVWTK
jgi:hypothetical protein